MAQNTSGHESTGVCRRYVTAGLNVAGGVAFLLGVVALVVFAFLNLKGA